jgi:hypothetical protein
VRDVPERWFAEARAATDGDARFLLRLRESTPRLTKAGLSADKSLGESWAAGPFVGVELDHLTAPLRWLWVTYRDTVEGGLLDCACGDYTRFDDWGPIDGNVYATDRRPRADLHSGATPEHAAEAAVAWISEQAHRGVRREEWDGRRPRTRWSFTDTGGVLWDTRPSHWRRDHPPNTTQVEQASPDDARDAGGTTPL